MLFRSFVIGIPSAVEGVNTVLPRFALSPNTPNPFNPVTMIRFNLDRSGPATLRIYSVTAPWCGHSSTRRSPPDSFEPSGTDAMRREDRSARAYTSTA